MYKMNQRVKMTEESIKKYGKQYLNTNFIVIGISTSKKEHPGYNERVYPTPLYDLRTTTNQPFSYSLYEWELENA